MDSKTVKAKLKEYEAQVELWKAQLVSSGHDGREEAQKLIKDLEGRLDDAKDKAEAGLDEGKRKLETLGDSVDNLIDDIGDAFRKAKDKLS